MLLARANDTRLYLQLFNICHKNAIETQIITQASNHAGSSLFCPCRCKSWGVLSSGYPYCFL